MLEARITDHSAKRIMNDAQQHGPTVSDKLHEWLTIAVESGGSDLHLIIGYPPALRLHGDLNELAEPPLEANETEPIIRSLCSADVLNRLQTQKNVDFSFELPIRDNVHRFRANVFLVGGLLGACLRVIPIVIPDFEWTGFPVTLAKRLAFARDGLVLVCGATGSGKTTTLAMVVNLLNQHGGYRIITVEEPVEYFFPRASDSVVTQREVGSDVLTFADGLKYGLRQDPDAILVGEIRDRETAQMALSAAETGHLVFSTLHTRDVKGAITRFADLFPQDVQRDVRAQLAMSLRSIVSQRLLPGVEKGEKRQLALEVLWNTHPIASSIRQGKLENIDNYLVTGRDEGMITFDESVRELLLDGRIARRVAEDNVSDIGLLYR
jgi:twitching motility protein PilT